MRTFAQKQDQPQKQVSSSFARSNTAILGPNHHVNPLLHVQRTLGNQAVQRPLRTSREELKAALNGMASPLFGHDFSRIPIHPPAAARTTYKSDDECEQEAERVANQVLAVSAHTGVETRASRLSSTASPSTAVIQPKLKVGEPNDKFEQEADRVADEPMNMPASLSPVTAISTSASVHPSSAIQPRCVERARGGGWRPRAWRKKKSRSIL